MNIPLLQKHIAAYKKHLQEDRGRHGQNLAERKQRSEYYWAWLRSLR